MPPKRACDTCIARKIKCSGSWPCGSCCDSIKKVECTYLKPPRRRGPKVRRAARRDQDLSHEQSENNQTSLVDDKLQVVSADVALPSRISKDIIAPIVRLYREHSYSVWPVINADALLGQLEDIELENTENASANIACLVAALCAATMAQLQLDPVMGSVDSTVMAKTCLRIRSQCSDNKEHSHFTSSLVSFFLHVYYAKVNQCNTAWSYIQEAISRILQLDDTSVQSEGLPTFQENDIIHNRELIFPLLWVSERGYAMHLGLSPSCIDPPPLTGLGESSEDIHVQGLLDLARLFIAFDQISLRHKFGNEFASATHLTETENRLSSLCLNIADQISTRTADCHITREWMRTILWQKALSMGLLSSSTSRDVMTFSFPAKVSRDLLHSLRFFSETDLLPLGRDQRVPR
ncbi:hypothetical protein N7509_010234 [Penicillium cosmopolitanum]|uniref:Zn(2)-C6 fungal-type domain-containing protein n=1 Tax=Penicillium cosmopolitanum TaxID=1131564 RepID=A0A9X0B4C7_9EURO|nr:uncharacterized protein N7509_010234 [Penicillium cosmopolitanum]KAJ5387693.1 hypothetical protein N7509_010234 [Penicillium cosmopolitanum]